MAAPDAKQRATTLKRQGFDDSVIGAILGLSSADVRALLVDADPAVTVVRREVFEVTDLVIPAGNDSNWSQIFGEATPPDGALGLVQSLYLEVAEELPSGVGVVLSGILDSMLLGDGSVSVTNTWAWETITGVPGSPQSVGDGSQARGVPYIYGAVQLLSDDLTLEDITVVRARVAYLIF